MFWNFVIFFFFRDNIKLNRDIKRKYYLIVVTALLACDQ